MDKGIMRMKKSVGMMVSMYLALQFVTFSSSSSSTGAISSVMAIYDEEYEDDHIALYKKEIPESYFVERGLQNLTTFGLNTGANNTTFSMQNLESDSLTSINTKPQRNPEMIGGESEEVRGENVSDLVEKAKDVIFDNDVLRDEKLTHAPTTAPPTMSPTMSTSSNPTTNAALEVTDSNESSNSDQQEVDEGTAVVEGSSIGESGSEINGGEEVIQEGEDINEVTEEKEEGGQQQDEEISNQTNYSEEKEKDFKTGKTLTEIAEGHVKNAMSPTSGAPEHLNINHLFTALTCILAFVAVNRRQI